MAISLGDLASRFGCDLLGKPDVVVDHVATLQGADSRALSFLANSSLLGDLYATRAAAVLLRAEAVSASPVACLVCDDPYAVYARVAALIHPARVLVPGIHATATVHASARVAASAEIGPNAVVDERSVIGEDVYVGPGSYVGPDCDLDDGCRLLANVTFCRKVRVGKRGVFHPGAVLGADGFGNVKTPEGWLKVPQVGGVRVGNDVEIGANSTVDCGTIDDTIIEDGVRVDNLCMIGHNVQVGAHTAMAAMVAIAGSTKIGKRCMFAGMSGSVGHVSICDDVVVSGKGMISKKITEPGTYASNFPAEDVRQWNRRVARFRRLETLYDRVHRLEKGDK